MRVIVGHRQGYASAGSLDPDVVAETLAEARDNAEFGEPDEWNALATLADVDGRRTRHARPVARRRDEPSHRREGADRPRPRSRHQGARHAGEGRRSRGLRRRVGRVGGRQLQRRRGDEPAHDRVGVRRSRSPTTGPAPRPATGSRRVAPSRDLDLDSIPRDAVDRACRLLGAKPIAGRRIPIVLDPLVTRSVLGVLSSAFNGESLLKGRSLFGGRDGEKIAAPIVELVDDPTDRACARRGAERQRRPADAPQRAHRRRRARRLPAQRVHGPALRAREHGQRSARRLRLRARCRRACARVCGRAREAPKR